MSAPSATAAAPAPDPYAGIDDQAARGGFVRQRPDGQLEAWLAIEGMVCAACGHSIEAALSRLPGVVSARVALVTRRAHVVWHNHGLPPSELFRTIARLGYTPYPADSAEHEQARQQASRLLLWRLIVAFGAMMQVMMYAAPEYFTQPGDINADLVQLLRWAQWMITLPVMLFCAWPILASALRSLRARRIGMDVPASLGIALAFVASSIATFDGTGEVWFDSVTMFVFFLLLARWLEDRARRQATLRLEALQRQLPGTVARLPAQQPGAPQALTLEWVTPAQLRTGDIIQIEAGMHFPIDGRIQRGQTEADESPLTGESRPVLKGPGASVRAGSCNLLAPVHVVVERTPADSTLGQIRQLVELAGASRPSWLRSADRWATVFLTGVLILAALGWWIWQQIDPSQALPVAIAILIVTCPCALSLATPSAMLSATAALARRGIWLRAPGALETLARANRVVFDKTGTLTEGQPALKTIECLREGISADRALQLAAALSHWSQHPLSRALTHATPTAQPANQVTETAGAGLQGEIDGHTWRLGRQGFVAEFARQSQAVYANTTEHGWPTTWLADADGPVARFVFHDPTRPDAATTIAHLHTRGMQPSLLSGDSQTAVDHLNQHLGLAHAHGNLSPSDKLDCIRRWQAEGDSVVMAGDGINDGPALAGADVGIVLGDATPLARQHADIILATGRLADLATARATARRAVDIMRQNLSWALGYNAASVPLAMMGYMPPWAAGLGMALSSLLVIGNGLRLLRDPATREGTRLRLPRSPTKAPMAPRTT